ncbi:unnamed protein product [Microthlaspi erraticum]|uniref:F-box associated beta-propeller type 3 domain-containing protein n=1 Tax=Microthlaspi erraticum TaxID=1685480 RepID=A0A6D2J9E0_9BRAS|nr:unnamed protein product [Microthlaspi erraticum]
MSLSLSRPRILLAFSNDYDNKLQFFSSPDHNSSLPLPSSMVALKDSTLTMPQVGRDIVQRNSVRGFVCCSLSGTFVVYNPTTRQVISLPEHPETFFNFIHEFHQCHVFLGYDPSKDQYKVLRLDMFMRFTEHSVCTLGGRLSCNSWRSIQSNIRDCGRSKYNGICIDGVVYFEAPRNYNSRMTVSSFDVGSEQLRLIKTPEDCCGVLTNYLGKLAAYDNSSENSGCFNLWVLDDVKNQVWSKRVLVLDSWILRMSFAGVTAAGEVIYVPCTYRGEPNFEIYCYNVEKKVGRSVRVEGLVATEAYWPSGSLYMICLHMKASRLRLCVFVMGPEPML